MKEITFTRSLKILLSTRYEYDSLWLIFFNLRGFHLLGT